jgi:HlyD family secretion protein
MKKIFFINLLSIWLLSGTAFAQNAAPLGVGALGFVEPRSRVLKLKDNGAGDRQTVAELLVQEGQTIPADAPLAVLAHHPQRKADLAAIEARLEELDAEQKKAQAMESFRKKEFERQRDLRDRAASSPSKRDAAEADWLAAKADIESLIAQRKQAVAAQERAAQELKDSIISAPFEGTVLRIFTRVGERLADQGFAEFADLSRMDVRAEVFESDIQRVKEGQRAEILLPNEKKPLKGAVYQVGFVVRGNDLNNTDPLADKDNRVVAVRIAVDPADTERLKHQIYRRVSVRILP